MAEGSRIDAVRFGTLFSFWAGVVAAGVGLVVLLGWQFDVGGLKSVYPGLATMKANTALAFVFAGGALALLSKPSMSGEFRARLGFAWSIAVTVIAALTLAEYLARVDLGIDEFLFRDAVKSIGVSHPGRMSFATALAFLLVGASLLAIDVERRRGRRPAEWLALSSALIGFVALLGYLYGVESLQRIGPYASMALHTATVIFLLSLGVLLARPERGLVSLIMTRGAGGAMGRSLIPAAILLPPFLGWVRLLGQREGWYDTEFGLALLVSALVVVLTALIWRNVAHFNLIDAERARAAHELRRGQELLKAIVDNSPAVIYVKDLEGRYLLVNRRFTELFERAAESVLGKTDRDLFPGSGGDAYRAMDQRVATAGRAFTEEETVPLADGPHTYVSVKAPLIGSDGETYAIFGISTDISDRKRAETERANLLASERAAREDAEALNGVARALASELQLQEVVQIATDAATRLTGAQFGAFFYNVTDDKRESYTLFTLSGAPREVFEKFGLPRNTGLFEPTFRGQGAVRIADVHVDARYGKNAPHHGMPKGHPPVRSYLAIPVMARSGEVLGGLFFGHAERDVFTARAERLVQGIAAQASIAIDNARLYHDVKHEQEKLGSQLGRLALLDHITRAIGQRQDLPSILQVVVRTLEERLPVDFACVCLYDAPQKVLTVARIGIKSETIARELSLTEQARIDVDGNGLGRCVGGSLVYEPDILTSGFPFPQRLARGGLAAFVAAPLLVESQVFGVLIAARRETSSFSSGDCEFLRQLSEHVALAAHQAQLNDALQRAYDDLRQTQDAVLQQERLRAIGQMASGIAHDINNAISPASLYVEALLERSTTLSGRDREHLVTIGQAIDDVAQTVGRLREFYRPRDSQPPQHRVDLQLLIQQVKELTRARWSDIPQERGIVIKLETDVAGDLPMITGAEAEIRDGLTNLIFNAIDAMPAGGTLSLCARLAKESVCVEVRDTGMGMDEATRLRCLEPFFTTKGLRGTGLGLAMVYGMVQRHGGTLEIDSEPDRGTTVRFFIPTQAPETLAPEKLIAARPARGLRILLVDDDPLLLNSLRDTLEADGHDITVASGGKEGIAAVTAAEDRGESFSVIITDLGMPHIDGRKVAAAAHKVAPHTPVILLTGWGQRLIDENEIPPHVNRVLSKPPKLEDLRAALAQLTAGR